MSLWKMSETLDKLKNVGTTDDLHYDFHCEVLVRIKHATMLRLLM